MNKKQLVALTIAAIVLLSPPSVFGKGTRLTRYQNEVADQNIKALEDSEPSEDNQAKNLLEMQILHPNASTR